MNRHGLDNHFALNRWQAITKINTDWVLAHIWVITHGRIDLLHKSHNTPVPYPTMYHFVTEMCTGVHISVTKWCIVRYLSDALWDLWYGSTKDMYSITLTFYTQIPIAPTFIYLQCGPIVTQSFFPKCSYEIQLDRKHWGVFCEFKFELYSTLQSFCYTLYPWVSARKT